MLTGAECDSAAAACIHWTYQLKKGSDGACIHLDENSRCHIYGNRPQVCRDFTCAAGWRLGSAFPTDEGGKTPDPKPQKEIFIERLKDETVFVPHPLIKLHTVFCSKPREEVVFVKALVGECGTFISRDHFHFPQMDDGLLLVLIDSFSSKDSLNKIHRRFCEQNAVGLTKSEFYEIVWLLDKHHIVVNAANFAYMLSGGGDI